jgi:hypothetical protein
MDCRGRKRELEVELTNLARAPASGQLSPTIIRAIAGREREMSEIPERIVPSNEDSIKTRVAAMTATVKTKLKDFA